MKKRLVLLLSCLMALLATASIFCLSGCKEEVEYKWAIDFSISARWEGGFNEEQTTHQVALTQEYVEGTGFLDCRLEAKIEKYVNGEREAFPVLTMETDDFKKEIHYYFTQNNERKTKEVIWNDYYFSNNDHGRNYGGCFQIMENIGKHEIIFYTNEVKEFNLEEQRYNLEIIVEESTKENIYIEMDDFPYADRYEDKITAEGIEESALFKDYSIYIAGENFSPAIRLVNDKGEIAPNYNSSITISYIKVQGGERGISGISYDKWRDNMDQGKGLYIMEVTTYSHDTYLKTRAMFYIYRI